MNLIKENKGLKNIVNLWSHPYTFFFFVTLLTFARALSYSPFVFDDATHIFKNPHMLRGPLFFIKDSLTPIPYLIWQFIISIFGKDQTFVFRITNILLHSFNALLIWKISQSLMVSSKYEKNVHEKKAYAFVVALLFLLHPIQVESVVWISALRTLLGGTFALSSLYFFLKYEENIKENLNYLLMSYIFIFLVVFTYPTMIAMILTLPFFSYLKKGSLCSIKKMFKERSFLITTFTVFIFLLLTFIIHKRNVLSSGFGIINYKIYFQLIFSTLGHYLKNSILPFQLHFDYQINALTLNYLKDAQITNHFFFMGLLSLLTTIALYLKKSFKVFGILLTIYIIFLLPNLGIINHDFNQISTVADRYLYLGLFPLSLIIVYALGELQLYLKVSKLFSRFNISLFLITIFFLLSVHQIGKWSNQKKFLEGSIPYGELSSSISLSLASLYLDEGNYRKAAHHYQKVLAHDPQNLSAFSSLIDLFFRNPTEKSANRVLNLIHSRIITPTENQLIPIAEIFLFLNHYDRALDFANQAIFQGIQAKKAAEIIENITESKKLVLKDHLEALFHIYYSTNNYEMSKSLIEELLKLYPHNPEYLGKKELIDNDFIK